MHVNVYHKGGPPIHFTELDDARKSIVDDIVEKMGTARTLKHQVECANGILLASELSPGCGTESMIRVGKDNWDMTDCDSYGCVDEW